MKTFKWTHHATGLYECPVNYVAIHASRVGSKFNFIFFCFIAVFLSHTSSAERVFIFIVSVDYFFLAS